MPRSKKNQKENKQNIYIFLAIVGAFFVVAFLLWQNFWFLKDARDSDMADSESGIISPDKEEVVLILDFGGKNQTRRFKTLFNDGETRRAWSLLQQASAYAGIDLKIKGNFIPEEIAGVASGENSGQWQLYINDRKQELKPFNIYVKGGDKAIFKYE